MLMKEKWENIYGNIKCGPKNKTGICLSYAEYSENKKGRTKIIFLFLSIISIRNYVLL